MLVGGNYLHHWTVPQVVALLENWDQRAGLHPPHCLQLQVSGSELAYAALTVDLAMVEGHGKG